MVQDEKETSTYSTSENTEAVLPEVLSVKENLSSVKTNTPAPFYPHFADTLYTHDYPQEILPAHNLKEVTVSIPKGIKGEKLPYNAIYDNWLFILIFSVFIVVLIAMRRGGVILGQIFAKDRRNENEMRSTVTEWQLSSSMIIMSMIMCGISMFYTITTSHPEIIVKTLVKPIITATAGMFALFLFQQIVIWIIGFIFFSAKEAAILCRKNQAYYMVPGIILIPSVIIMVYFPNILTVGIIIAIITAALLRIIFLCRIFKFFLYNIYSLFYIILYLCAVEITPLLVIYRGVVKAFFCL
ncbi:MAG: DUF4271 domain-containing protein [Bacteroidales bacterium]